MSLLMLVLALAQPVPAAVPGDRATAIARRIADPDGGAIVVAHRGCHNPAPRHGLSSVAENSPAALDQCVALGVDVMELDVRRTRDGHLVILHDATVDRTTDGHGKVVDLTLAAVRALHLRDNEGGAGTTLTDARVPTLDEMLAQARGRIVLNLDVKDAIYAEVVAATERAGAAGRVIVKNAAGIGDPPLAALPPYDRIPFMPILSASDAAGSDLVAVMRRQDDGARRPLGYELPRMDAAQLPGVAAEAKRQHRRLWCNSLWDGFVRGMGGDVDALRDPQAVWGRMIAGGISMIQTDEPEALLRYLGRDKTNS